MARSFEPDALARRVFVLVVCGVAVEIGAMLVIWL